MAVVRNPYLPADEAQTPLSEVVARLPGGRLGYTAAATQLVVDQYRFIPGEEQYSLQLTAFPLPA